MPFLKLNKGDGIMNHPVTENNSNLIRTGCQIFFSLYLCCKIVHGFETTIWRHQHLWL